MKETSNGDIHLKSDYKSALARASGKHWTPVITVPRPFSMTLREEDRKEKTRSLSRASLEVQQARLERERLENEIIKSKKEFKARPAPPETCYPLYHDLVEQSENRRKIVSDLRKEELNKIINPFSFAERDQLKAKLKAEKIRIQRDEQERLVKITADTFKATELDKSILENKIDQDAIEYDRQMRIKKRSEKLLRYYQVEYAQLLFRN